MAVSGLEQRRVPLVIASPIWSPWGPGLMAPYSESGLGDQDDHNDAQRGLKPSQSKSRRSLSWGGYSTHVQLASRGLPTDSDLQSEPETPSGGSGDETPPTTASEGRGRRRQRSRQKLALRRAVAPKLQPAPDLSGIRRAKTEAKQGVKGCDSAALQTKPQKASAAQQCDVQIVGNTPITTLAIRNLPYSLSKQTLLEAMDESGFAGLYDFCYLPCKFKEHRNLGFAFVNFISEDVASKFCAAWQQTHRFASKTARPKPLNVCPAAVQGRHANEKNALSHKMGRVKNANFRPTMLDGTALPEQPCRP